MSKKKSTKSDAAKAPKLKGSKAKEFPHVAEALSKPLGEPEAKGEATAANEEAPPKPEGKAKGKAKAKKEKVKKVSALDAAARVLTEAGEPMGCKDLIDTMASKGYWSSPKGLTPAATLYAAILREIKVKGKEARFAKTDKGKFAAKG